jgi:DNA-binding CsgD family transcriptional regulator
VRADETRAMVDGIDQGRQAFHQRAWGKAFALLSTADAERPLGADDLERLAAAAYLAGMVDASVDAWTRAHRDALLAGDMTSALRSAFWVSFVLLNAGELVPGGGWVRRAERLVDQVGRECVERGHVHYVGALQQVMAGDLAAARNGFGEAIEVGARFANRELVALARVGLGRCLIAIGDVADGMAMLEEAMAAVHAHDVSATAVGDIYCTVIEGCQQVCDVQRARTWTAELSRWCDGQPELVLFRGQCLVHRAELMLLAGAWHDAVVETRLACDRLAQPAGRAALGAAHYVRAELARLAGAFPDAEEAYRSAGRWGRDPQPGLARLRLAQGRTVDARAALRRALGEAHGPIPRCPLLAAVVEIDLADGDVAAARSAADDLAAIATAWDTPFAHGLSAYATGVVTLEEGDVSAALGALRRAASIWDELDVPYEAARARVVIGAACRAAGDEDTARMAFDAARSVFHQLGAKPDAIGIDRLTAAAARRSPGGLTAREVEVLTLLAAGKSNRAIASQLFVSDKTIASHVSNIFTKLGVTSRSAATAVAYQQHLV